MRNALVKNGIPFIDLPGNVFLPFAGIVLQDMYRKQMMKKDKMMPATQMVFLKLFYMEDGETVLKSEVAKELHLTKTSITRATALSLFSQLNSPRIEECAIYKGDEIVDQFEIADTRYQEWDKCIKMQLWKYNPSYFAKNGSVDPVSLACSFMGNEDERIEMCIEEIMEEI